jgi:hypothetical protein
MPALITGDDLPNYSTVACRGASLSAYASVRRHRKPAGGAFLEGAGTIATSGGNAGIWRCGGLAEYPGLVVVTVDTPPAPQLWVVMVPAALLLLGTQDKVAY